MFSLRRLTVQAARARPSSLSTSTFAISRASRPHNLAELRTFESLLQMRWNSSTGVPEIPPEEQDRGNSVGSPLIGGRMQRRNKTPALPSEELYIGNLSFYTTEEELHEFASQYGTLVNTRLIYDRRGLSKGFGYVKFSTQEEAAEALEQLNGIILDGRNLSVQFAARANQYGKPSEPTKTLFVGNMSYDITDEDLNDLFKDIRNCIDVRVAVDRRTAQPRGFAHCDFVDIESATKAKDVLDGLKVRGRALRCDFSSHLPGKGKPLAMDPTQANFDQGPRLRKVRKDYSQQSVKESPSTETDSPSAEAPSTEASSTETSSTETSSTEAPSTEAPSTEASSTETSSTEAPSTEAPSTEAPSTETPSTETPSTETPSTETPSTETPSAEAPSTGTSPTVQ